MATEQLSRSPRIAQSSSRERYKDGSGFDFDRRRRSRFRERSCTGGIDFGSASAERPHDRGTRHRYRARGPSRRDGGWRGGRRSAARRSHVRERAVSRRCGRVALCSGAKRPARRCRDAGRRRVRGRWRRVQVDRRRGGGGIGRVGRGGRARSCVEEVARAKAGSTCRTTSTPTCTGCADRYFPFPSFTSPAMSR
mgnify:CR=1 FL=1